MIIRSDFANEMRCGPLNRREIVDRESARMPRIVRGPLNVTQIVLCKSSGAFASME